MLHMNMHPASVESTQRSASRPHASRMSSGNASRLFATSDAAVAPRVSIFRIS